MCGNPKRELDVRFRKLGDRYILAKGMDTYEIDQVASLIWQCCDGNHSIADIASKIVEQYDVDYQQAAADCAEYVEVLRERGMVGWE